MEQDKVIELCVHVLSAIGVTAKAKSRQIAEYALSHNFADHALRHGFALAEFDDAAALASRLTRCINLHKNQSKTKWAVDGSPTGGWKLGPLADQVLKATLHDMRRPSDSQFTGLAGEYAVMSELLAVDWNVSKLPHDDGVDVIAIKDGLLRTIQVKTAHESGQGKFSFSVVKKSHDSHDAVTHYYVLVLRTFHINRYVNEFVILNTHDMNSVMRLGAVKWENEKTMRVIAQTLEGRIYLGTFDCTEKLNNFRTLIR